MKLRQVRTSFLFLSGFAIGFFAPSVFRQWLLFLHADQGNPGVPQTIQENRPTKMTPGPKQLIFVGVMTAEKFLDNRAKAVFETWGSSLHGSLAFFSSSSSRRTDLPVVSLDGVDDSYPPQRKSMMMLKYMHDHFVDDYEWFMRCDDDVYVRTDKLREFINKLDSSEDVYLGCAGMAKTKAKAYLKLGQSENYCMGGPGVVISSSTLRKFVPHIKRCMNATVTHHEDVEVGRCLHFFAGISCTWALEVWYFLFNNAFYR